MNQKVRDYIIYHFCPEGYANAPEPQDGAYHRKHFPMIAKFILDTFRSETKYHTEVPQAARFRSWCQGLPSVLDTCYYYNRPAKTDLLRITGAYTQYEDEEQTERICEQRLTRLLYEELICGEEECGIR